MPLAFGFETFFLTHPVCMFVYLLVIYFTVNKFPEIPVQGSSQEYYLHSIISVISHFPGSQPEKTISWQTVAEIAETAI